MCFHKLTLTFIEIKIQLFCNAWLIYLVEVWCSEDLVTRARWTEGKYFLPEIGKKRSGMEGLSQFKIISRIYRQSITRSLIYSVMFSPTSILFLDFTFRSTTMRQRLSFHVNVKWLRQLSFFIELPLQLYPKSTFCVYVGHFLGSTFHIVHLCDDSFTITILRYCFKVLLKMRQ